MLVSKLKTLVNDIKSDLSHFDNKGYYYDPLKETADGFQGVTDLMETYFFIQILQPFTPNEYKIVDLGSDSLFDLKIQVDCILVASLKDVNMNLAGIALLSSLKKCGDLNIIVTDVSTQKETIYAALYKGEQVDYKNELIMISFTVEDHITLLSECDIDFCVGGC